MRDICVNKCGCLIFKFLCLYLCTSTKSILLQNTVFFLERESNYVVILESWWIHEGFFEVFLKKNCIDALQIELVRDTGLVGWGVTPGLEGFPVDTVKEWMVPNIISIILLQHLRGRVIQLKIILKASNSFIRIPLQQQQQQRLSLLRQLRVHGHLLGDNVAQHLWFVLAVVRRLTTEHFVEKGSEGPPVDFMRVTLPQDNFWRQVLRCTAKGVGLLFAPQIYSGETEIGYSDMSIGIEENIFRLEIAIYHAIFMQVAQCFHKFGCVYFGSLLRKIIFIFEIGE